MLKRSLTAVSLALFAGCATSYHPKGFFGGYSETRLGKSVFRVDFLGNGYTRAERASDFAMLRSAELALQHGYPYLVVVEAENIAEVETYTGPVTWDEEEHVSEVYVGSPPYRPRASITIACFAEKPGIKAVVYEARPVADSISGKYRMLSRHDSERDEAGH